MTQIVMDVMGAWVIVAMLTGLLLGSFIHAAEKLHREEVLEAIFSRLANQQFQR